MKNTHVFFALLVTALLLTACGGATDTATETPADDTATAAESTPEPASAGETSWEKDGLKVTALTDSPEFPDARLAITGIEDGQALASGTVPFSFAVEGYELGAQTSDAADKGLANSAKGQHIHLILNNGPYSAHYEAEFEKELDDGHYVMLAFLSRSYHESLKNDGAALVRQFSVGETTEPEVDLTAPHLFYSRPKGTYQGADSTKLMLDFFLLNTDLSPDGNKVRATINGSEFTFSKWVPYVIEGLPMGEVEISLELIDAAGQPVPGPFNSVTRTVTLEAASE